MNINQLGVIIGAFIVILVGVILLNTISDSLWLATELSDTSNETIAITSGTGTTANADITAITFFGRPNISSDSVDITIGTQINFTKATGVVVVDSINFSNGDWNISYGYEGSEYITDSNSRTVLLLIKIFFAVAILLVAYMMVAKSFADIKF